MGPSRVHRDAWVPAGLAAATVFGLLATAVVAWGGLAFDAPVIAAVGGLPVPDAAWEAFTFLGGGILVTIGIALGLWALATGRLRLVLIVAAVLIGAALFTEVVKLAVARPRPPGGELLETGFSFPSGHSLNSAATYGLLAVVAWRSAAPALARRVAALVALVVPVLVGLSRIAIGVHYPSDVLGGWSAGIAFVAAGATAVVVARAMAPGPGDRPSEGLTPESIELEPEPVVADA